MSTVPTRQQLLALYRQHLGTARSIKSYNYREYFVRHARESFRAALIPESAEAKNLAESATVLSGVPSGSYKPEAPLSTDIAAFYERATRDLEVLRRVAVTNAMYSTDRLVVEANPDQWFVSSPGKSADQ